MDLRRLRNPRLCHTCVRRVRWAGAVCRGCRHERWPGRSARGKGLLSGQARASWRRWLLLRREKELQALAGRQKWGSTFPGERDRECVKAGRPNGPWGAAGQRRRDRSPESCHRHRVADTFPYSDSDQWLSPARTTRPSPTPTGARKGAALMTGCGQALVAFAGQDRECCVTAEGRTLPPRVPLTYLCQTPVDVP